MIREELNRFINQVFTKIDNRFINLILDLLELHEKKTKDYGSIANPEANIYASSEFGIPPEVGIMLRMNDKFKRLKQFAKEKKLENESVEDSLMDLANYALLALFVRKLSGGK